jgi:GNAT superfamily N-acetyltransferase
LTTHITGSTIRLARPSDEPEIIEQLCLMHREAGWAPLDIDCVRVALARCWDRTGGIIAVIGAPGHIRAMLCLHITHAWFTRKNHIEEMFCWVHPDHRRSDYARLLIEHAKKWSDDISQAAGEKVPLMMSILTNKRMAGKVRLYRRVFGMPPAGAVFAYNTPWISANELCEEDFWKVPSLRRLFLRRAGETARKDKTRASA